MLDLAVIDCVGRCYQITDMRIIMRTAQTFLFSGLPSDAVTSGCLLTGSELGKLESKSDFLRFPNRPQTIRKDLRTGQGRFGDEMVRCVTSDGLH